MFFFFTSSRGDYLIHGRQMTKMRVRCCYHHLISEKVKNHPVKAQAPDQPGSIILAKEPILQANFARAVASLSKAQAKKVARFIPNPERHWGPKLRAGRQITSKHVSLLGPEAVNGHLNNENSEETPQTKRPKAWDTNDPTSNIKN